MAFVFNQEDIKFASSNPFVAYGGQYNVTIEKAEHKGQTKNGMEMFGVWFKVADTDAAGATIYHTFMDDSSATTYNPFRYREIMALLAQTGLVQNGQSVELVDVVKSLPTMKMNVTVKEFEKSENTDQKTGKKSIYYNARVGGIEPWLMGGSEIDESNPKPESPNPTAQQAPQQAQPQFGGGFNTGAPLPPEPQTNDAFGGGF